MDYLVSPRIGTLLERLDARVGGATGSPRTQRDQLDPDPSQPKPLGIPRGVPGWMRNIIESRGIRLPHLERALDMERIVVAPTFGSPVGLKLTMRW